MSFLSIESIPESTPELIVGVDEVGYGCIFGPICCAAAVILNKEKLLENLALTKHAVLRDSKKMTERQLKITFDFLTNKAVHEGWITFGIGSNSPKFIDEFGLSKARIDAFHKALDDLETNKKVIFSKILVDGNFFKPYKNIPHQTIVKGDASVLEIMCASIIAKHYRDSLLYNFIDSHPELELQERYKLRDNVGYATKAHLHGIVLHGPLNFDTEFCHRTSYSIFKR
jgi:ribonuclease HII